MSNNSNYACLLVVAMVACLVAGCSPYTKGEPIAEGLDVKNCLLVLDIQNDFISPEGKMPVDHDQAATMIHNVNRLVTACLAKDIEIIYIGNEFEQSDRLANFFRKDAAIQGTDGVKLAKQLLLGSNTYFVKSQPDAFSNQDFDQYLRTKKITEIMLTGVFADQCILSTLKGAVNRHYSVQVVSDGVAAKNDKNLAKALKKYSELEVLVVATDQLITELQPEKAGQ